MSLRTGREGPPVHQRKSPPMREITKRIDLTKRTQLNPETESHKTNPDALKKRRGPSTRLGSLRMTSRKLQNESKQRNEPSRLQN